MAHLGPEAPGAIGPMGHLPEGPEGPEALMGGLFAKKIRKMRLEEPNNPDFSSK